MQLRRLSVLAEPHRLGAVSGMSVLSQGFNSAGCLAIPKLHAPSLRQLRPRLAESPA
jgi:hypothetical protein